MDYADICQRLDVHGLICRGGIQVTAQDEVPLAATTVILVGNAGPAMWRKFNRQTLAGRNPLDRWTREVLTVTAGEIGATALFPFDGPPYLPFQKWAMRADRVYASPIGPLIHPEFGLWHAYRAALAFAERIDLPKLPEHTASPCDSCRDKPCLKTCPVNALTPGKLDTTACIEHLGQETGDDCFAKACLARRACPVGRRYAYAPTQARFHMTAFYSTLSREAESGTP